MMFFRKYCNGITRVSSLSTSSSYFIEITQQTSTKSTKNTCTSDVHRKSGSVKQMVQHRHVVTPRHYWEVLYGLSIRAISNDVNDLEGNSPVE